MKKNRYQTVRAAVLLMLWAGGGLFAAEQAWLNNSLSFGINKKFTLMFTNESRYDDLTYSEMFMRNWQGGMSYNFSKKFYFSLLYKREDMRKPEFIVPENRFTLESGWKTKLSRKFDFDIRFRFEIRNFKAGLSENHLRFRLRYRVKTKMKIGQLKLNPFIALEPFGDTVTNKIFRCRIYAGFVFPLGEHAGFVLNYIHQITRDKDTVHILNSGVELKF